MTEGGSTSRWEGDLLGYTEVGETFTRLVKSMKDETKVISIEAGYGRGKTFFRAQWADHLRKEHDEVVVEIDAHLSDHSGDPVLTFIGSLVAALPKSETSTGKKLVENGRKYGGLALRSVLRVGLRQGAEELIDLAAGNAMDAIGESDKALKDAAKEFGDGLSKAAGDLVVSQIAAERIRNDELPQQMDAVLAALTKGKPNKRVIVMVDELDRCHPDYAIAFLEAMKLVFAHDGFVFCLFVNDEYLEGLAAHRFGAMKAGERYLDKFIDIRLKLPDTKEVIAGAAEELFKGLSEAGHTKPFGEGDEFTIERAARLAGELAPMSELSMRQIERVKLRVELALRCYPEQPLDYALLVLMAFLEATFFDDEDDTGKSQKRNAMSELLPRSELTPSRGLDLCEKHKNQLRESRYRNETPNAKFIDRCCLPFFGAEDIAAYMKQSDRYSEAHFGELEALSANYLPDHKKVLHVPHLVDPVDSGPRLWVGSI